MKKFIIYLVLVLWGLQFVHGQSTFIKMCGGDSYTWYLDTQPTSQVVIRAMKPGSITYDTIHSNQIVLSPQDYTIYDIISIDGSLYTCNETLEIEVIKLFPNITINGQNLSITVSSNLDYSAALYIHITDYNNALIYRYYSQTGDTINIDNIPSGNYKIYITTEDTGCQITDTIAIP